LAKGYRDVVIAELNAKVLGSQLRDQSIGAVREIVLETQYGSGLNGGSIETAHLHLRAYADHAQLHGLSFLFADLAGAFASVIRRLGIGNDVTDIELARRLRHIGFTGEQICATIDEMKQMRPWDDAKAPKQIQALLRDLLGTTWISMEYVSKVLLYTSGTAAGTSIADIIFAVAFKSVLFEVRKLLSNQQLIYKTEANTKQWDKDTTAREVIFQDISYSDDVAYPIISDKATLLIPMSKKTMEFVDCIYSKNWHGSQLWCRKI
jgi:hypothetical protein